MCGIVGIVTANHNGMTQSEADAFRDMLVIDSLRGFDSTGVFGVSNLGNVGILKAATSGSEFVKHEDFREFHSEIYMRGVFAVGHNRYATKGAVNDKNAHPFWPDDKIVLVQNGTYKGDHKHHKDTEVDTEAVAHVIAEHPDDIQGALKKINAAYAFVWYNVKNKTLYMIRNSERPLYIADTKSGGVMFASEMEMIMFAAGRNNIALKELPVLIKPGQLLSFKLGSNKRLWEMFEEDLDITYDYNNSFRGRFPHVYGQNYGQVVPFQKRAMPPWYGDAWDEDDWSGAAATPAPVANQTGESQRTPGRTEQDHQAFNVQWYIYRGHFSDIQVTKIICDEMVQEYTKHHRRRALEIVDYKPGNARHDCTVFTVIGEEITPNENDPKALFHKTLFNTTEEEVMAMVGKVYQCSVYTPIPNHVNGHTDDDRNYLISILINEMECVEFLNNEQVH